MEDPVYGRASFLGLPCEIRLQILKEAISIRRTIPALPSVSQDRTPLRNRLDPLWPDKTNIYVEAHDHAPSAQASLLTVCRQIRGELEFLLERIADEPYELDVMFVEACGLLPTWVSIPCLRRHISCVEVRIRIFKLPDDMNPKWVKDADFGDALRGILCMSWNIMVLLSPYVLKAGWKSGAMDAFLPVNDENDERRSRESGGWCTIDEVIVRIEESDIRLDLAANKHDEATFAYDVFHGASEWPTPHQRPDHLADRAYGPDFKLAQDVWVAVNTMSGGNYSPYDPNNDQYSIYNGLLLSHIGAIDVLVGDYRYQRCDVTTGFRIE